MRAVLHEGLGGVEKLRLVEDFPKPEIREVEVLIRVKAVALNHLDIWVWMGALAVRPELPHILGADISGVVERVGSSGLTARAPILTHMSRWFRATAFTLMRTSSSLISGFESSKPFGDLPAFCNRVILHR